MLHVYSLATAGCQGVLPEYCHALTAPTAHDPNGAPLCLHRENRDDGDMGFRKDHCDLTVLSQKVDMWTYLTADFGFNRLNYSEQGSLCL